MSSLSSLECVLTGEQWPLQSPALQKGLLLRISPFQWTMTEDLHWYISPWNCGLMLDTLMAASHRWGGYRGVKPLLHGERS